MKEDTRTKRQLQIEAAAYALLAEKGYASTSMLSIAKRAKCSNETMYNWYGDKKGLIEAMVTRNAQHAKDLLTAALEAEAPVTETLETFGAALLELLLGDRPIALNRAAAADPTGELGAQLAKAGRQSVFPHLVSLLTRAQEQGEVSLKDTAQAAEIYLGTLIGDLQIRRVIYSLPDLTAEERAARSKRAIQVLKSFST